MPLRRNLASPNIRSSATAFSHIVRRIPTIKTYFAERFSSLVLAHRTGAFLAGDMLSALTLHHQDGLRVAWAPFDHIARTARLVVVGITPGRQQAENALLAFQKALATGISHVDALRLAKQTGSFSGPMRTSLVDMLDHVGAQRNFGVTTCATLFEPAHELAHFTSALRHPVFVDDANYNGAPGMLKHQILRTMIETHLAEEAEALPKALWLPLGSKPTEALYHLADRGILDRGRILDGLPHPSGANGERIAYFLDRKERGSLSLKTPPGPIDSARDRLRDKLSRYKN